MEQPQPFDWEGYIGAAWRSDRARELDKFGGLTRPPLRRGASMNAKLQFLGSALAEQGQQIKTELYKSLPVPDSPGSPRRAISIRTKSQKQAVTSVTKVPSASSSVVDDVPDLCPISGKPTTIQVATWRLRVHAARRRAYLKLLTIIRFWKGIHAPTRCRRVANWGWAVQKQLDDRLPRFLEDQTLSETLRANIEANVALLEQLCRELSSTGSFSSTEGNISFSAADLQSAADFLSGKSPLPATRAKPLVGAGPTGTDTQGLPRYRCSAPGFLQIPQAGNADKNYSPSRDLASGGLIEGSALAQRSRQILLRQLADRDNKEGDGGGDPSEAGGQTSLPAMLAGILGSSKEFIRTSSFSGAAAPSPPPDPVPPPRVTLLESRHSRSQSMNARSQMLPPMKRLMGSRMRASDCGAPIANQSDDLHKGSQGRGRSCSMSGGPSSGLPSPRATLAPLPPTAASPSPMSSGATSPAARSPRPSLAGVKRTPPKATQVGFGSGFSAPTPPRQPAAATTAPTSPTPQVSSLEKANTAHMSHMKLMKHMSPLSRGPSSSGTTAIPAVDGVLASDPGSGIAVVPQEQQVPRPAVWEQQPVLPPTPAGPVAPTILRRTVAAAAVVEAASRDGTADQDSGSQSEAAAPMDPQTEWRLKLAKLRRGDAVQPVSMLVRAPPAEAAEPPPFNPWLSRDPSNVDEQMTVFQQMDESPAAQQEEVEKPVEAEAAREQPASGVQGVDTAEGTQQALGDEDVEQAVQGDQAVQGVQDAVVQDGQMSNWKRQLMREIQELDKRTAGSGAVTDDSHQQASAIQDVTHALEHSLGTEGKNITQEQANRIQELIQKLKADVEALRAAESRMAMHIGRVNSAWARDQSLGSPELQKFQEMDTWLGSTAGDKYKADILNGLKMGRVAFLFNAFQDEVTLPNGQQQNLWCSDPWDMVSQFNPDEGEHGDSTWGGRVMLQLLHTVQSVAGPAGASDAVSNAFIIIAMDDSMQESVTKSMWLQRFYGFNRQRVIFVMQPRRQGHVWCASAKEFVEDALADSAPVGSGVTLMQMAWVGEAFMLDASGEPVPLPGTVMELLEQHHVTWMLSRRAADMSLITKGSSVSLPSLTYASYLRDQARMGMLCEVHFTEQPPQGLQETVVLGCKSVYQAWHQGLKAETALQLNLSEVQSAVELTVHETQNPEVVGTLAKIRTQLNGKLPLSCGRYTFHVPTLKSLLTSPLLFRPKLRLAQGGLCSVIVQAGDMSGVPAMRCLAAHARPEDWQGLVQGHHQLKTLTALLHAQDGNPELRKLAFGTRGWGASPKKSPTGAAPWAGFPSAASRAAASPICTSLNTIVVFVISNRVSQTAVDIACSVAKQGRDHVRLVTFVSSEGAVHEAHETLLKLYRACINQSSITTDVVVRGDGGLLDAMEAYLSQCNAYMAVMGSVHMMLAAGGNLVIGSVVLTLLRRANIPILVVTANSNKLAEGSRPRLRIGLVVDRTARPLHSFLCQHVADPSRGDALIFMESEQSQTGSQAQAQRRMLDSLSLASENSGVKVLRNVLLSGPLDEALLEGVDNNGINILGMQMSSPNIPPWIQGLIRACKGAVLVHPFRPAPTTAGASPR